VEPHVIANERIAVDVEPASGGRLAQIRVGGTPLLVGRDDVPESQRSPDGTPPATAWGAFPMVPWAGRIRHGRFDFRGRRYSLPINFGDHAIHGVGFASSWTVAAAAPDRVRLELALPTDARWPFGGLATHEVSVVDAAVRLSMEVTAGDQAFPVSFGWHPWFRKPSRVDFHPARMYRRDAEGIAVDELVPVRPGPWDDCFTNTLPVGLTIDGVDVQLRSECTHWVVFDEFPHATCVEPQTGPPDAFNIAPRVLEPGESHRTSFEITAVAAVTAPGAT
jgi:aldose 1-epimerase